MKTTKTFRLLAVLLALVLAFGAMPALAVEIDSSDYAAWTQSAVDDLYGRLMAAENYEDYIAIVETLSETARTAFFNALSEEQQAALEEHAIALTPASEPFEPIVRFTKVGPLLPAPASGARMMRAAARNGGSSGSDSGIVLNKTAVKEGDSYKITLEAYATGSSQTIVSTNPVDIVLVLDVSGSMDDPISSSYDRVYSEDLDKNKTYYFYYSGVLSSGYRQVEYDSGRGEWGYYSYGMFGTQNWNTVTPKTSENDANSNHEQFYEQVTSPKRIDALKSAVNDFIDNVADKSPDSSIAIVKFAGDKKNQIGNDTYREGRYTYNYSQIVKDLTKVGDNAGSLKEAVNSLRPAGATAADYGMEHARTIVNNAANDSRKKVVIMFTDGEPNHSSGFSDNVANDAISASKSIKEAGATVYTIGIFSGADGTPVSDINNMSNGTNKYMHLVSSNYKKATSMSSPGQPSYPAGGKSYFLSAGSHGDLMTIFKQISEQVGGSTSQLDATSVIKDVVTPYFDMPANTEDVKLYTAESDGSYNDWKKPVDFNGTVTIDEETRTVSVTGFNFKENWCGNEITNGTTTFHNGKKLIIEFTVKPKDGFLGGNGVPTNESAGVYKNAEATEPVASATVNPVDVQIKNVVIESIDTNVYLGAQYGAIVNGSEIKNNMKLTIGGVEVDLTEPAPNYGLADWQKKYVDIEVKVTDKDGKEVTNFEMLDDQQYKVTVTVKPTKTGTATEETGKEDGTIHVFTPELTFKDSEVSYMASIANYDYAKNDYVVIKWRHQDAGDANPKYSTDPEVTMLGNVQPPELTYEYTPDATRLTADKKVKATDYVPVAVKVKLGETDVTNKTTFVHQACVTDSSCQWDQVGSVNGDPAFLLHVKGVYADLTITKSGASVNPDGTGLDAGQSFLFTVTGPDYSTEVIIVGNGSVTLKNLKIGTYTVTEDTNWSWRYKPENVSESITLKANEKNEVKINNTRDEDQWLDGNVSTDNKFTGAAATTE